MDIDWKDTKCAALNGIKLECLNRVNSYIDELGQRKRNFMCNVEEENEENRRRNTFQERMPWAQAWVLK